MGKPKLLTPDEVEAIEEHQLMSSWDRIDVPRLIYTIRALYRTIAAVRVDSSAQIVTEWDDERT